MKSYVKIQSHFIGTLVTQVSSEPCSVLNKRLYKLRGCSHQDIFLWVIYNTETILVHWIHKIHGKQNSVYEVPIISAQRLIHESIKTVRNEVLRHKLIISRLVNAFHATLWHKHCVHMVPLLDTILNQMNCDGSPKALCSKYIFILSSHLRLVLPISLFLHVSRKIFCRLNYQIYISTGSKHILVHKFTLRSFYQSVIPHLPPDTSILSMISENCDSQYFKVAIV
jgi:hypothetical protein